MTNKASRRHSATDEKDIQEMLDLAQKIIELAVRQGALSNDGAPKPAVIKQADGAWRWFGFSSSSFKDRDEEYVTQKALEADVEYADRTKEYGDLRWWHTGVVLGSCDFNAMHDKILVESGIIFDEKVAQAVKEHADELGISLGFYHPVNEPDANGCFHTIRRYERSLLPRDKMSNLLAAVPLIKETDDMQGDKIKALTALLSGDEKTVTAMLEAASKAQATAEGVGMTSKEEGKPEGEGTPAPNPETPMPEKKMTVGEMAVEDFAALLAQALSNALSPVVSASSDAVKEASGNKGEVLAALKLTADSVKAQADETKAVLNRLAVLEGDLPTMVAAAYRASGAAGTVVKESDVPQPPAKDPLTALVEALEPKS